MSEARDAAPGADPQAVVKNGNKQAAAVLGFSAAVGAYGGFFIPKSYGTSITLTGSPHAALWLFIVFYLTCIVITWWFYARHNAVDMPGRLPDGSDSELSVSAILQRRTVDSTTNDADRNGER